MKQFSFILCALICATLFFSSCGVQEELVAKKEFTYKSPDLPKGVTYLPGADAPTLVEKSLDEWQSKGWEVECLEQSNACKVLVPASEQAVETRGPKIDNVCLSGFDYFPAIPNPECTWASTWKVDLIYNMPTTGQAKFYVFDPLVWAENGQIIQAKAQALYDSIYWGLLDIGVNGFGMCLYLNAYTNPSGSILYSMNLFLSNVPPGVAVSFQNWYTVNCNGVGYVTPEVELEQLVNCNNPAPGCTISSPTPRR